MAQVIIGVDIAKDKFDVARLSEGRYRHKQFTNHPEGFAAFLAWRQGFGDDAPWVCMEATGTLSIPLAEFLVEQSYRVSVINPAKVHAWGGSSRRRSSLPPVWQRWLWFTLGLVMPFTRQGMLIVVAFSHRFGLAWRTALIFGFHEVQGYLSGLRQCCRISDCLTVHLLAEDLFNRLGSLQAILKTLSSTDPLTMGNQLLGSPFECKTPVPMGPE